MNQDQMFVPINPWFPSTNLALVRTHSRDTKGNMDLKEHVFERKDWEWTKGGNVKE